MIPVCAIPLIAAAAAAAAPPLQDVRVAIVVGNNRGLDSEQPLRWAEQDARRVHAVLTQIGAVAPRRAYLVLGGGPGDLLRAVSEATGQLRELSAYTRTALVVYVSSHADEEALHLGGERLALARLRAELGGAAAQLRLVIVDACRLAVDAGWKGGRPVQDVPVVFDQSAAVEGEVLIAAAGPGELAQEWAHLRGSLFTHHLVSALRGAADYDRNGRVTLTEAYSYAYRLTIAKAAEAGLAPQRPSFDIDMAGFGDWVFTNTAAASAQLALAEDIDGRVWITDRRSDVVAEVEKHAGERLRLALSPGLYRVVVPAGMRAYAADVSLPFGGERTVATTDLVRVPASRAVGKGGGELIVLRPWELAASYAVSNGVLPEMSSRHAIELGVTRSMGDWSARLALGTGAASITGEDVDISHQEVRLAASLARTVPLGFATVGLGVEARPAWVWQHIERRASGPSRPFGTLSEDASGFSFALGPLATASIPIGDRARLALDVSGGIEWIPRLEGELDVHYFVQPRISFGWSR